MQQKTKHMKRETQTFTGTVHLSTIPIYCEPHSSWQYLITMRMQCIVGWSWASYRVHGCCVDLVHVTLSSHKSFWIENSTGTRNLRTSNQQPGNWGPRACRTATPSNCYRCSKLKHTPDAVNHTLYIAVHTKDTLHTRWWYFTLSTSFFHLSSPHETQEQSLCCEATAWLAIVQRCWCQRSNANSLDQYAAKADFVTLCVQVWLCKIDSISLYTTWSEDQRSQRIDWNSAFSSVTSYKTYRWSGNFHVKNNSCENVRGIKKRLGGVEEKARLATNIFCILRLWIRYWLLV